MIRRLLLCWLHQILGIRIDDAHCERCRRKIDRILSESRSTRARR